MGANSMEDNSDSKIEKMIARYHHRLELVRTTIPVCILILQILMVMKVYQVDVSQLFAHLSLGFINLPM